MYFLCTLIYRISLDITNLHLWLANSSDFLYNRKVYSMTSVGEKGR